MNITYSAELMKNYKQANVISPQKKFKALQTNSGDALLFSIGTDGVFYLIQQSSGSNTTGWEEIKLSAKLAEKTMGSQGAKDFSVAQNASTGKIDLALVMTANNVDTLYLSLGHDAEKGGITSDIVWSAMTYDDPQHAGTSLQIADVFISQHSGGEYIVADVSEKSFSPPSDFLKRYYIDPSKSTGTVWNSMVIGGDLDPGVQTRLGRKSGDRVDGTYTLGKIGGVAELLYAPLYNPFSRSAPPTITRLIMPSGASALALADSNNKSTDLFVAAGHDLYFFAADNQKDNSAGQKVFSSPLFQDVTELHAYRSSSEYVVWGLNRADQIFYTSCAIANVTNAQSWSVPVPILSGVDKISAYVNKADDANTIFSAGTNQVNISVRSPETTIWNTQSIQLVAPPESTAQGFSSYTTRVQLDNGANNPAANTEVLIASSSPIPVYINQLYYVLNKTPIPVKSDALGSLTIVEAVDNLTSVQFTIAEKGGSSVTINPMEKPFNKIASLDSSDKLKGAVITSPNGSTKPLVGSGVSSSDLDNVAQANKNLAKAYTAAVTNGGARGGGSPAGGGVIDGIETDVGDLFNWLESGIEHVVDLVENAATGFWHFIVHIGEEIYQGILDTVEAVVGAVRWIYNAIKVAIEDLIKFLEFLFEWGDITRTKEVMKNLVMRFLRHEADQIEVVKQQLNDQINQLVQTINGWAGIDDWSGLGAAATQPANQSSTPNSHNSAPGNMMSFHLNNNAQHITPKTPVPSLDPGQSPIDTLIDALKREGTVLSAVIDQIHELSTEYENLDLETIIKRIIAIIADGVLESAEVVIDALLDLLYELVSGILDVLDTDIYIPIVSDILKEFGVPSVSFLDLFCWAVAIPATITYKIAAGSAPFPDDANTNFLKTATTWDAIQQAFSGAAGGGGGKMDERYQRAGGGGGVIAAAGGGPITMPPTIESAVFVSGHAISGFCTLMSCFISTFEAEAETGENPFAIPSAVLGVLAAASNGIAGFLVPKDPIKNSVVGWVNKITTLSVILAKLIFSGPAQKKFGASKGVMKNLKAADGRATGAIVNSILVIPALVCTCWHFYELAQDEAGATRSSAIIDETANVTSYISRISYAIAVNDEDPESKQIPIAVMVIANIATGGLQTAESIVGR